MKITLPPTVEESLRKGVFVVGSALERLLDEASEISRRVRSSSSVAQPVLSLEGQIPVPRLKEIINEAVQKMVIPAIPNLVDKTALEMREGMAAFVKTLKDKGASVAMHVDMGGSAGSYGKAESGIGSIRGLSFKLPFEDGFFDFIIGHLANQYQGDITKVIKEFSRILSISGSGVIIDFHPFGMYAKRGSLRLRPVLSTIRGLEDYFKTCKSAGLKIVNVKEFYLDEGARQMFATEEEKACFRVVKDTPLLICLFVRKGG